MKDFDVARTGSVGLGHIDCVDEVEGRCGGVGLHALIVSVATAAARRSAVTVFPGAVMFLDLDP